MDHGAFDYRLLSIVLEGFGCGSMSYIALFYFPTEPQRTAIPELVHIPFKNFMHTFP